MDNSTTRASDSERYNSSRNLLPKVRPYVGVIEKNQNIKV